MPNPAVGGNLGGSIELIGIIGIIGLIGLRVLL